MSNRFADYDESDVRVRPNRRGSRPRTKDRPAHKNAVSGMVLGVDRGRYRVLVPPPPRHAGDDTTQTPRIVTAMRARELTKTSIVVGDIVAVVGDVSGEPDTLARIVRISPRRTVLRRTADDTDPVERVIVANADQLGIVVALANPDPSPGFIDRALVAAFDAGIEPLIIVTKADLADPSALVAQYAALDVPWVATAIEGDTITGLQQVRERLSGLVTVLVGHSGVGKSTLVNELVPEAERATGKVNQVTGRGRHTSTSAIALPLPNNHGWVIDTPGVRSFGLAHVDEVRMVDFFPDLAPGTDTCPRGCGHDEPDCGLDEFVTSGGAGDGGQARLDSLRRLLRSRGSYGDSP